MEFRVYGPTCSGKWIVYSATDPQRRITFPDEVSAYRAKRALDKFFKYQYTILIDHSFAMNVYPTNFYEQVVLSMKKNDEVAETFDHEDRLVLALRQLEDISILVRGNEYESYLMQRIISLKCELQRQYNLIHKINAYV